MASRISVVRVARRKVRKIACWSISDAREVLKALSSRRSASCFLIGGGKQKVEELVSLVRQRVPA